MISFRTPWVVVAVALLVFVRALSGTFHFDDYALLVDPAITDPAGWLTCFRLTQTRPLTWFSFWANYQLGGELPLGYLAVNLLLHCANSLLVRIALARLAPLDVAAWGALLFAVHPFAVEPVDYIFARGTLLATMFALLSIRAWAGGKHWHAVCWFTVGMLAKEEIAALPVFFLLLHLSVSQNRKEFYPIGAMLAIAFAAGLRVIYATSVIAGAGSGFAAGITPFDYFSTQGSVILTYARMVIWPFGFSIDPAVAIVSMPWSLLSWAIIAGFTGLAFLRFSKARIGFWAVGALVLLLPSSSIFPAADLAADRRMYLPMIAVAMVLGYALQSRPVWLKSGAVLVFALLSSVGINTWLSEQNLWANALELAPRKVRPRLELSRFSEPDIALRLLDEAQEIAPANPAVASSKARIFLSTARPDLALKEFGRALALEPANPVAISNRGAALAALKQFEAAAIDFNSALRLDPCQFDARFNLRLLKMPSLAMPSACPWNVEQKRKLGLIN